MKIISFAWTSAALVTGNKTVTRRDWQRSYAEQFQPGEIVQAYNRSPRFSGECIATIRIESVTYEPNRDMPDSDYEAEGLAWLLAHPDALPGKPESEIRLGYMLDASRPLFDQWRRGRARSWVCRFSLVELTDAGRELAARFEQDESTVPLNPSPDDPGDSMGGI